MIFILFLFDVNSTYFFREFPTKRKIGYRYRALFLTVSFVYTLRVTSSHVIEVDVTSRAQPRDCRGKVSFDERIVVHVTAKLIRILRHCHGVYWARLRPIVRNYRYTPSPDKQPVSARTCSSA